MTINYRGKCFTTLALGVDPIKRFWKKFTHSFFKARSFHSNATKSLTFMKWPSFQKSVSKFMPNSFKRLILALPPQFNGNSMERKQP